MADNATHWHAGRNMPASLPETPYERFDGEREARQYINDELERWWDAAYDTLPAVEPGTGFHKPGAEHVDAKYLDAHTALHNGAHTVGPVDGYLLHIYKCSDNHDAEIIDATCGRCRHTMPASTLSWDGEDYSGECACGGLIREVPS